ncbi:hypothetical protein BDD12DRAFT_307328 [Trichophaea hybrida]|nr:hypothetical protein BDD12DRAFT_307328 [Trichophaea hybrida]
MPEGRVSGMPKMPKISSTEHRRIYLWHHSLPCTSRLATLEFRNVYRTMILHFEQFVELSITPRPKYWPLMTTPFTTSSDFFLYTYGKMGFPVQQLEAKGISESDVRLIKRLMKTDAGSRLTADQAQKAACVTVYEEKDWEYVEIDSDAEVGSEESKQSSMAGHRRVSF